MKVGDLAFSRTWFRVWFGELDTQATMLIAGTPCVLLGFEENRKAHHTRWKFLLLTPGGAVWTEHDELRYIFDTPFSPKRTGQ